MWRFIETAPTDTTKIIVSVPSYKSSVGGPPYESFVTIAEGRMSPRGVQWYDLADCDRDGCPESLFPKPTFWMPLPSPVGDRAKD